MNAAQHVDNVIAHWNANRASMQALIAEARAQRDEAIEASDGWQALYVAASAKLASIRATPFQQVDPESGELAWASGYNAVLKIVHNLAAEDE